MKAKAQPTQPNGFSLIELLMAIAIISMLAAIAMVAFTNVSGAGRDVVVQRNAHQFCTMHAAAVAAGVEFHATTQAGILDELVEGRRGRGLFAGSEFRLPLVASQKPAVLELCAYDAATGMVTMR